MRSAAWRGSQVAAAYALGILVQASVANAFDLMEFVIDLEGSLNEDPSTEQVRAMRPIVIIVSWMALVAAWTLSKQAAFRRWVLPSIQGSTLHLEFILMCMASVVTYRAVVAHHAHFVEGFEKVLTGYMVLVVCVSSPRSAVCVFITDEAEEAHMLGVAKKAGLFLGMVPRSRSLSLQSGRAAAILLLVVRPIIACYDGVLGVSWEKEEAREGWWSSGTWKLHPMIDPTLMVVGIILACLAGARDLSILAIRVEAFFKRAYVVIAFQLAMLAQQIIIMANVTPEDNVDKARMLTRNLVMLIAVIQLVEAALVCTVIGSLSKPDRNPLITFALTVQAAPEDIERMDLSNSWRRTLRAYCTIINVPKVLKDVMMGCRRRSVEDNGGYKKFPQDSREVEKLDDKTDGEGLHDLADMGNMLKWRQAVSTLTSEDAVEIAWGRQAWALWGRFNRVPRLWPGSVKTSLGNGDDILQVYAPGKLTPAEETLQEDGELIRRSSWGYVQGDMWSERVRSTSLVATVVVCSMVNVIATNALSMQVWKPLLILMGLEPIANLMGGFDAAPVVLLFQLMLSSFLWLVLAILLNWNNPFTCATWRLYRVALLGLAVFQALSSQGAVVKAIEPILGIVEDDFPLEHWISAVLALYYLFNFFLALYVVLLPTRNDDFHVLEINAVRYTQGLLRCSSNEFRSKPLKPGEKLWTTERGGAQECVIKKENGDGTSDIQLKTGVVISNVRHKRLTRVDPRTLAQYPSAGARLVERVKLLFAPSASYPVVLQIGALSVVPALVGFAAAIIQKTHRIIRAIYWFHIACSIGGFLKWSETLPEPEGAGFGTPSFNVTAQSMTLQENMAHWHYYVSTLHEANKIDTEVMNASVVMPAMYFRWDVPNYPEAAPSQTCHSLAQGRKLADLIHSFGGLREMEQSIVSSFTDLGLPTVVVTDVAAHVHRIWKRLSQGMPVERDITPADAGDLLCALRLDLYYPWSDSGGLVSKAAVNATGDLAEIVTEKFLKHAKISKAQAKLVLHAVVESTAPSLKHSSDDLLDATWSVVDQYPHDGELSVNEMPRFASRIGTNVQRAAHVVEMLVPLAAGGQISNVTELFRALDFDSDGFNISDDGGTIVSLTSNACALVGCSVDVDTVLYNILLHDDLDHDGTLTASEFAPLPGQLEMMLKPDVERVADICDVLHHHGDSDHTLKELIDYGGVGDVSFDQVSRTVSTMSQVAKSQGVTVGGQPAKAALMAALAQADEENKGSLTAKQLSSWNVLDALRRFCPSHGVRRLAPLLDVQGSNATVEASKARQEEGSPKQAQDSPADVFESALFQVLSPILGICGADWVALVLIGVECVLSIAICGGLGLSGYTVFRCFRKYRVLFEKMQKGDRDYQGHTTTADARYQGFAESTMFPGILFGNVMITFCVGTVTTFLVLGCIAIAVVPQCGPVWIQPYLTTIWYLVLAYLVKVIIKDVFLNGVLVSGSNVVYPAWFSLFWFIQILLNFILGVSLAVYRALLVIVLSAIKLNFLDVSIVDEDFIFLDSGYCSFLSMVVTQHERRNPVKKAIVTALMGQAHRVYGKTPEDSTLGDEDEESGSVDGERASEQQRKVVRARWRLLLTLHNNPELIPERRHDKKPKQQARSCFDSCMNGFRLKENAESEGSDGSSSDQ